MPIAVLLTAPLHSLVNVAALRLGTRYGQLAVSAAGVVVAVAALGIGWLLHA
jgi:hypothetical protein